MWRRCNAGCPGGLMHLDLRFWSTRIHRSTRLRFTNHESRIKSGRRVGSQLGALSAFGELSLLAAFRTLTCICASARGASRMDLLSCLAFVQPDMSQPDAPQPPPLFLARFLKYRNHSDPNHFLSPFLLSTILFTIFYRSLAFPSRPSSFRSHLYSPIFLQNAS